ncbi:MAG: putative toxin-antitoxin system toxin component, PIN family [Acidobacteria bacterium]|nr:putative toxin-antitoxin system toxin component, PIN family [Acidobacteriota bacterium]
MNRVVLDTNVLLSALISPVSPSAEIYALWIDRRITVLSAPEQLDKVMRVTRYPRIRALLHPSLAGRLVNRLRDVAVLVEPLPVVDRSPDPDDNYLLAIAEAGRAHYLVTGDKPVLGLKKHMSTTIIAPAALVRLLKSGK